MRGHFNPFICTHITEHTTVTMYTEWRLVLVGLTKLMSSGKG